jgi:hypothetical protein
MKITFIEKILTFVSKTFRTIKNALSKGQAITAQIKAVADSPILKAIVSATSNKVDDAVLLAIQTGLTEFAIIMGWADKLIKDFDGDKDARTTVLTALAAKAAVIEAEHYGHKLTMQQALAATPVAYNPDIVKV